VAAGTKQIRLQLLSEAVARRMAIANGTCVSFCNQHRHIIWVPHERHAGMSLPGAGQESLRHILASPGYAPWTIAVNVTRIDREFNACETPRSMYTSIFNRFPVIRPVSWNFRHFSTFLHILAFPGYDLGTIAVNVTRIERGFNASQSNAACSHLSSTVYEL